MRINSDGNVALAKNIGLGGATPSTSGTGITFPATASGSTDANTLDDYEEGTWTVAALGTTTAGTYVPNSSYNNGKYVKIGRSVTVICSLVGENSTGTGNTKITGLPFASDSVFQEISFFVGGENFIKPANTIVYGKLSNSSSEIRINTFSTSGTSYTLGTGLVSQTSGKEIYFTLTYTAS
jgi:hypothetical protein